MSRCYHYSTLPSQDPKSKPLTRYCCHNTIHILHITTTECPFYRVPEQDRRYRVRTLHPLGQLSYSGTYEKGHQNLKHTCLVYTWKSTQQNYYMRTDGRKNRSGEANRYDMFMETPPKKRLAIKRFCKSHGWSCRREKCNSISDTRFIVLQL